MGEDQKTAINKGQNENLLPIDTAEPIVHLNRKQVDTINAVFESEKICRRALTLSQLSSPKIGCKDTLAPSVNIWTGKIAKIVYFSLGVIVGGFAGFGIGKAL